MGPDVSHAWLPGQAKVGLTATEVMQARKWWRKKREGTPFFVAIMCALGSPTEQPVSAGRCVGHTKYAAGNPVEVRDVFLSNHAAVKQSKSGMEKIPSPGKSL